MPSNSHSYSSGATMNPSLKSKLTLMRDALLGDADGLVAGKFFPGGVSFPNRMHGIDAYYEFLALCDGARCGRIDLWSHALLHEKQNSVDDYPGGSERWVNVGQILYEPLLLERNTERIFQGNVDPPFDVSASLGHFDTFLDDFVFGNGYILLAPNNVTDEWNELLQRSGLADKHV